MIRSTLAQYGQVNELAGRAEDIAAHLVSHAGLPCVRTMSGAGHDVVLVAGGNGGISHTPREYSNAACANVTDVLANAALRLADQP
jgi:beta-ureidopropionase / N-carbamoyl-L-amino-acid hydrolase